MAFTAADVKKLREETDAPMMECKSALTEADGDMEKARTILREKGKAAAMKRADRNTAAGVVALAHAHDHKTIGGVVLECETDFVARNEKFIALAHELAEVFLHSEPGADPLAIRHGDKTVGDLVQECVATFRENARLSRAVHLTSSNWFATYVHHDNLKAVVVEVGGEVEHEIAGSVGHQIAVQAVAFPPEFISKDEIPAEKIASEIALETQKAINDGKDAKIAENIARGRVNKEFIKRAVLLEQDYYREPELTVSQYIQKEAKGAKIVKLTRLAVGEGA
jgi:elongation factor Ts